MWQPREALVTGWNLLGAHAWDGCQLLYDNNNNNDDDDINNRNNEDNDDDAHNTFRKPGLDIAGIVVAMHGKVKWYVMEQLHDFMHSLLTCAVPRLLLCTSPNTARRWKIRRQCTGRSDVM
jgi:hypothetical protein